MPDEQSLAQFYDDFATLCYADSDDVEIVYEQPTDNEAGELYHGVNRVGEMDVFEPDQG